MKLVGLVGGMTWENTMEYYSKINKKINANLGGWSSSNLLLYSVEFSELIEMQNKEQWSEIANYTYEICSKLEKAGTKAIMICSNTMHKIADEVQKKIDIPIIHVVDETANIIKKLNISKIGLLGTKTTMTGDFYVKRLENKHNIEVLIPDESQQDYINHKIYIEFANAQFPLKTKEKFNLIIQELRNKGAQGIILGCTELPLLLKQEEYDFPLFDTMEIHINAVVDFQLTDD